MEANGRGWTPMALVLTDTSFLLFLSLLKKQSLTIASWLERSPTWVFTEKTDFGRVGAIRLQSLA